MSSLQREETARGPAITDVLTLGFGASVAMWSVGYLGNLPALATSVPRWAVVLIMLGCLFFAAFRAGQLTGRGWLGGLWSALISSSLNLLVLAGAWADLVSGATAPAAILWIVGYAVLTAVIGVMGGALGRTKRDTRRPATDWLGAFTWVSVAATLLLIVKGGIVTSYGEQAAMSVPDWPQSFGYNMFLLPLSKMVGAVYFEHSHRLFGTLVGLVTLCLAVLLNFSRVSGVTKLVGWLALIMVIIQGVLGGGRVLMNNTQLAFTHGVLAQLFIGVLAVLSVMAAGLWNSSRQPKLTSTASADRAAAIIAVFLIVVQLLLGAIVRHFNPSGGMVMLHITVGTLVLAACITAGVRNWGNHPDITALRKGGTSLMHLVGTQYALGFGAWATGITKLASEAMPENIWQVILPTVHQAVGALLLVFAVRLAMLSARLLKDSSSEHQAAA